MQISILGAPYTVSSSLLKRSQIWPIHNHYLGHVVPSPALRLNWRRRRWRSTTRPTAKHVGAGSSHGQICKSLHPLSIVPSTIFCKAKADGYPAWGGNYIQMQNAQETCAFKTVLSGGAGFVLGGAFGLFMASVSLILSLPILSSLSFTNPLIFSISLPPFLHSSLTIQPPFSS